MNQALFSFLAHAGHPAPETHGDLTHLLLGFLISLPVLIGIGMWIKHLAKKSKQAVKKD